MPRVVIFYLPFGNYVKVSLGFNILINKGPKPFILN